ncbi:uncharacterized protein LOC103307299 isoform X2 [Chrysemys picta bellii]|uniref:uncharacterized protein LOC103307299 isoform X2 n=1 Tax=Chrysemys picta bellii TaxID=8478 RepID=UPI0032B24720
MELQKSPLQNLGNNIMPRIIAKILGSKNTDLKRDYARGSLVKTEDKTLQRPSLAALSKACAENMDDELSILLTAPPSTDKLQHILEGGKPRHSWDLSTLQVCRAFVIC